MSTIITHIKNFIKETDKIFLILCVCLSLVGVLAVQSASRSSSNGVGLTRDAKVMIIAVAAGIVISLFVSVVNYEVILKLWPLIGAVCIGLMVLLFFIGVGPDARSDVKTWIVLGGSGLYFQPSELVKVGFIITFSAHLEFVKDNLNKFGNIILLCIHAAIPTVLVTVSGDMGSALIFLMMFVIMMFAAGVYLRYFAIGAGVVAVAAPLAWKFIFTGVQKERILALIHPDEYPDIIYQQSQGLKALGSGGLTGQGLFKGYYTQHALVPEGENDMIFATIGEELGIIGCVGVLVLFVLVVVKIFFIGKNSGSYTVNLLCTGVAAMIASQVVINVGMVLKLLPVVGITLPFLSAGGSSNLCIYLAVGLVLCLKRGTYKTDIKDITLLKEGIL